MKPATVLAATLSVLSACALRADAASTTQSHAAPQPSSAAPASAPAAAAWRAAWTNSLTKVFRDPSSFSGDTSGRITLSLARNEYESVQLVIIGGPAAAQVRIQIGPLVHVSGNDAFPPDVIEVRPVAYVRTRKPGYSVPRVGDWPDALPPANGVAVAANTVQPVWITLGAPERMAAGQYQATITLTGSEGQTQTMRLIVRVWDFSLPRQPSLKTAFGVYRNRLVSAYRDFVPQGVLWANRIDELERLCDLELLKHRVSPMMDANPFDDGFGQRMALYRQVGLSAFAVGAYGGNDDNHWPSDAEALQRAMHSYHEMEQNLRERGLLDMAYVYAYDEPKHGDRRMPQIMASLRRAATGLRRLLVMDEPLKTEADSSWVKDASILCMRITAFNPEQAQAFIRQGKEMWMYVSSPAGPFAGLVIDEPAIHHRLIPWMCWKYGATGLLYWCANYWKLDPWRNPATYRDDQNGNGVLLYPTAQGPVPSLRLEVLRDGIEDYEYLSLLRGLIERAHSLIGVDAALLARAERLVAVSPALVASLKQYTDNPRLLISERDAIAETIEALQAAMASGDFGEKRQAGR